MKFDYVVGNPPYQKDTSQNTTVGGANLNVRNIFQDFQHLVDEITINKSCLIYPGRWVFLSGRGLQAFGHEQLNDPHLMGLKYYENAADVFPNVGLDSVSVVLKDYTKTTKNYAYEYHNRQSEVTKAIYQLSEDDTFIADPNDVSIVDKIKRYIYIYKLKTLYGNMPDSFGIESRYVEENPDKVFCYDVSKQLAEDECKVFTNDKAGSAGKPKWYVMKIDDLPKNKKALSTWKVVTSSAHTSDWILSNKLELLDNQSAYGRSRIALGMFNTKKEAELCINYFSSYIIRWSINTVQRGMVMFGKNTPILTNYTDNSLIDCTGDIDMQLKRLIGLTDAEFVHIKESVNKNIKRDKMEEV